MFLFVFLAVLTFCDGTEKKLRVGIYIESECRFSKQFITNQFRPAYKGVKNDVDFDFFTFGKSESFIDEKGQTQFKCQHGQTECQNNKLQTCGLHFIGDNQDLQGKKGRKIDIDIFFQVSF